MKNSWTLGQAVGTVVKMKLGIPVSHNTVPGFETPLHYPFQFPVEGCLKFLHPGHPHGTLGMSSNLLVLSWTSPDYCRNLGNESESGRSVSACLSLFFK